MAHTIQLTTAGYSGQCSHSSPTFYGKINVEATSSKITLSMSLTTNSESSSGSFFNYDVAYTINGTEYGKQRWSWSGAGNHSITLCTNRDISNVSFPITIVFTCQGCDHAGGNSKCVEFDTGDSTFIFYDNRHTHISAPSAPTITATTGKTITVSGGDQVNMDSGSWKTSPNTFTGLNQGSSHTFKDRKQCSCGDWYTCSGSTTGKTWSISGSCTKTTTKTMTFKATHTAGTKGSSSNIVYALYKTKSTSGTAVATKTAASGTEVTFTGLDPKTTYYCYAYSQGISDNDCWLNGTTKEVFTVGTSSKDASAKTIRGYVTWDAKGSTGVTCTYSCNGTNISRSTSGLYAGFTGLTPGTSYTISYTVKDDEDNTLTGTITITTRKTTFGSYDHSTKIIEYSSYSNYSDDIMQHSFNGASYKDINQNTNDRYNNLTHNTSYTIKARIKNCFAFDSSGTQSSNNDSEISMTITTDLFSLSGSIYEEHQHRIITLWQSYVAGSARNSDSIDGTKFEFSSMVTKAVKKAPYQRSEVKEGTNGNTTGTYQTDKKIYSENLTWYYCEYQITANISDGYNVVSFTVTAHTTFPHAWIYKDGKWHKAMGYIYTGGVWVPAPCFVCNNNVYKEPNGE